jgi:hypothetical protein
MQDRTGFAGFIARRFPSFGVRLTGSFRNRIPSHCLVEPLNESGANGQSIAAKDTFHATALRVNRSTRELQLKANQFHLDEVHLIG